MWWFGSIVRLFVAIELPDVARAAIADEQKRLKIALDAGDRSVLKWVAPAHLHLTLVFLGEVDPPRADRVVDAMRPSIGLPPFTMVVGGLGVFPPRGLPRALWVGVQGGADAVIETQRHVVGRLAGVGIVPDGRPFHPHLTLARWRTSRNADRRRVIDADRQTALAHVEVDGVTLIESRLSSAGPAYTALCHAGLRESALPPLQSSE
jgi:RNA 2',3'-cyclic 3'-phosphodiesterase